MNQRDEILLELKKRGKRITSQRKIILEVILGGKWSCCKEIYYEAVKKDPNIGIATVYRMIDMLEEMGLLERTMECNSSDLEEESEDKTTQVFVEDVSGKVQKIDGKCMDEICKLLRENGYCGIQKVSGVIKLDNQDHVAVS